ncbi:polyphosphate kinase 2 family protein, partial [Xanthomonas citri pv. citri]|nr:polyphosphate kinase 2 family protein [Xanthomonas citri pv. citri]
MADTPAAEAGRPARPTDDSVFGAPARELFAAR